MWTPTTRKQHSRQTDRYQTDVTDEEWRVIEPHLPAANSTGRPRAWPMREIVNGIFYVMRSGCPWRLLPSDLPPWGTIYRWFAAFRDEGRFERINHALVMFDRERVERHASPTGAIIDSQSVKTTEAGGPRGYDAGKSAPRRRVSPMEEGSIQTVVDLIWKLTSGSAGQLAGPKPRDKGRLGDRAIQRAVTRVKSEQASKESMQMPTRLLLGEGRANREAIDTCTCSVCRGYWTRHVGMVMRVIEGDPSGSEVAASTPLMAVDRAEVGQGHMTVEAG